MAPFLPRRLAAAVVLAFLGAFFGARPAEACSICRCGDPTFNAFGPNIYSSGQWMVAFDWDRLEKEQGSFAADAPAAGGRYSRVLARAAQGQDLETVTENRYTLTVSYSIAERVVFVGRLPYSTRSLVEGDAHSHGSGLSDPEFYGLVRLWASSFGPGLGRRTWISALFGVKTPWGQNDVRENGERLDEHVQPGTGSTDLFGGLSAVYIVDEKSSLFASAQYRGTGRNDFGYKYGNITLANLAYERKFGEVVDTALELNFRHALEDQVDAAGTEDPNTGGSILYVTPRLILSLGHGFVARVSVQIPTWKDLNGIQKEKAVVNAGLTVIF